MSKLEDDRSAANGPSAIKSESDLFLNDLFNDGENDEVESEHIQHVIKPGSSSCMLNDSETSRLEAVKKDTALVRELIVDTFRDDLTRREIAELRLTNSVYYIGKRAVKKEIYEDNRGYYLAVRQDQIMFRYRICYDINQGSYGSVFKAYDCKFQKMIAIKVFRKGDKYNRAAKHEHSMLSYLKKFESYYSKSVVEFYDFFYFRDHSCLTFELLGDDLSVFIHNNRNGLEPRIIKTIITSILKGLAYLHEIKIIHADLKPNNVAIVPESGYACKILDIGLSLFTHEYKYNTNVQTTPYRAPEVFLKAPFDCSIDIFSLGTITTELAKGQRVFHGSSDEEFIFSYVEVFGFPPRRMLDASVNVKKFFFIGPTGIFMNRLPGTRIYIPNSKKLEEVLQIHDRPLFLNFVRWCFCMDAEKRPSARQLLKHKWFSETV